MFRDARSSSGMGEEPLDEVIRLEVGRGECDCEGVGALSKDGGGGVGSRGDRWGEGLGGRRLVGCFEVVRDVVVGGTGGGGD
jgi:hypothetical protein